MLPLLILTWCSAALPVTPPTAVRVFDTPNDEGGSITVQWQAPACDTGNADVFRGYQVLRATTAAGPFREIGFVICGKTSYDDREARNGVPYYYIVRAVGIDRTADAALAGPVTARAQWFNLRRLNVLIITLLFGGLVLFYIERARRGGSMFIRRIAGLDAIDDAVGRATEMGRPLLYSFGLSVITDVVTIASLSIMSRVARKAAEYGTRLLVPHYDPIVMAASQETAKQAYAEAGRPDLYREDDITFLTTDQFGYAAGVDGMMLREKPGAIFFQGYFYAESLIMAETGHSVGAIQIAGTTAITQLPFFIAACDYTLIGEEMFAASVYLNREPQMLGSLKGEDITKALIIGLIAVAAVGGTVAFVLDRYFQLPALFALFERFIGLFNTV